MNLERSTEAKVTASAKALRYKFLVPEGQPRRPIGPGGSKEMGAYEGGEETEARARWLLQTSVGFGVYLEHDEKSGNKKPLESFERRSGRV